MLDESGSVREGFLEPAEFETVSTNLPAYLRDAAASRTSRAGVIGRSAH
jgi:hypothetical protein